MPRPQASARPNAPQTAPVPGLPARRAALRLLDAVLRRGQPLEVALPAAARDVPPGPDRALAHALASATLRRLPDLDRLIDGATRQRLPDDAKARAALRLALAQALSLRTPPHAAIATVLPLVDGGPRRLVHGVFGGLMRAGAALPEAPALPAEVDRRWRASWGDGVADACARLLAAPPPLDLTLRDPAATADWAGRLGAASLLPGQIRLPARAAVAELPGYDAGDWWVQDAAASLPARALGAPFGGGRALDLCAAPGGKAMQLAAAGWAVTAVDQSESRLARLRENFARTRLSADVVRADVLRWAPAEPYDAVLVDAPCSATGIFRRHPDVLHRAHARFVADMAELQAAILARAADWVRPGGLLAYATCSLEREEGEDQAARLAAARPDLSPDGPPDRVLPDRFPGGCDGFFLAGFRRL